MTSKSDNEQPVRLALLQYSFSRSELKEIYVSNSSDQEGFDTARRTSYKPRPAVFIFNKGSDEYKVKLNE